MTFNFEVRPQEHPRYRALTRVLVPDEETSVASLQPDVNLKNLERKSHDFLK